MRARESIGGIEPLVGSDFWSRASVPHIRLKGSHRDGNRKERKL